jgi:hypothetical protein
VAVQDAIGNVVATAVNSVTLTAYSNATCLTALGTGTLDGAGPLAAVAGYATFSQVAISGSGAVYLRANSAGLASACSAAINVSGVLFSDVAASFGVVETTNSDLGWAAFSDLNGEGRPDLAVATSNGHQVFFNSDGGPWRTGALLGAADRSVVLGDCNNDGWRDVFTTSGPASVYFFRNAKDGGFIDERVRSGLANQNPEGAAVLDYNRDGLLDYVQPDGADAGGHMGLWRNTGDCIFTETTAAAGLPRSGLGNGEQVIAVDYDVDGDVDLFYTRSQGLTNGELHLYRNNGSGTFTEISTAAKLGAAAQIVYRAGIAVGDWDNDGDFDLFIGRAQGGQRSLLRNDISSFTDVTASSGDLVASTNAVEGCSFGDFDNDGLLDLYVAGSSTADELYRNVGGGAFALIDQSGPNDTSTDRDSSAVAVSDVDLDGDLDVYVANRGVSPSHLYLNRHGGSSFLKVKVRGRGGMGKHPVDGTGAVVQLFDSTGASLLATREVSGGAFSGQNDPVVHFGLASSWGGANGNYVVKVRFNNGLYTVPMTVRPATARLTLGSTTLLQTIEVVEP